MKKIIVSLRIKQPEMEINRKEIGALSEDNQLLFWEEKDTNTKVQLNFQKNELEKENQESKLHFTFSLGKETLNHYFLKETNMVLEIPIFTSSLIKTKNEFEIHYQVINNVDTEQKIEFYLTWEEMVE